MNKTKQKMKKIFFMGAILASAVSFTSCSGDDDSNNGTIVGKWNFSIEKVTFGGQTVSEGAYSDNEEGCNKDYLEFTETTAVNGDYFGTDCDFESYSSTYTRSGNTLTVTEDGDVSTVEVVSVNSNTLVLRTTEATEAGNINYETTLTKA